MSHLVQEYAVIPKTGTPLATLGSGSATLAFSLMIPGQYFGNMCLLCDRTVGYVAVV